jgi:hypothetical protein
MPFTDPFSNTPPDTRTIGRGAAFDNTAPAFSAPTRGSAFDNTAPDFSAPSRGAAFSNTGPTAATITRGAAFNNAFPDSRITAIENLTPKLAVAQTTASIVTSSLVVGAIVDGVTLAWGNLVLVGSQSNAAQNGLYRVTPSTPVRETDHAFFFTVKIGPLGTTHRGKQYSYTPLPGYVPEITAVNFTALVAAAR